MRKSCFLFIAMVLLPGAALAQMPGMPGATPGGVVSAFPVIAPSAQMVIGADGNAYILTPDRSVLTAMKTTVSAILPFSSASIPAWKKSIDGFVSQVLTGAGTVILPSTSFSIMPLGMLAGALPSTLAIPSAPPGKIYFLKSTDGTQVAAVDITGFVSTMTVRTVSSADYLYVVTSTFSAPATGAPAPLQQKLLLTMYTMGGSVFKTISAANDNIAEEQ